jgi:hypothetical protein
VFLRKLDFFPILTAVSSFSLLRLDEKGKNDQSTKYINSIRARIKCLIAIEDFFLETGSTDLCISQGVLLAIKYDTISTNVVPGIASYSKTILKPKFQK